LDRIFNKYGNIILGFALLTVIIAIAAKSVLPCAYFYPIDGNYQNYNIVRRILDGQIPYKDFAIYLGLLHAYLGAFFTFIFGNNFCACTFVFNLLTVAITALFSLFLGLIRKLNFKFVCAVTIGLILLLYFFYLHYPFASVVHLVSVDNSAKMVRFLPLLIGAVSIYTILKKVKNENLNKILIGATAGVVFPLSNDFGIVCAFAIAVIFTLRTVFEKTSLKKKFISMSLYIAGGLTALFTVLTALTRGHIVEWFTVNRGISEFQSWYYNHKYIQYFLYKLNFPTASILSAVFTVYLFYKLFIQKDKIEENIPYLIISISCITILLESNYMGGMSSVIIPWIIGITIFWYFAAYLRKIELKNVNPDKFYVAAIFIGLIFSGILLNKGVIEYKKFPTVPEISKSIGGKYSNHTDAVADGLKFLNGKKVFSTYSSAIEDISGQFQPSEYDYIIHALGEDARKKYLDVFKQGNFDYVITQRPETTEGWELWVRNTNFDFYKELYKNYIPVYYNDYSIYWEKTGKENIKTFDKNTQIIKENISPSEVKITIKSDKSVNGIADLSVDYDTVRQNTFNNKFLLNSVVAVDYTQSVKMTYEESMYTFKAKFTLPHSGAFDIPVIVFEGEGSVILKTLPAKDLILKINNVTAGEYYPVTYDYTRVLNVDNSKNIISVPLNNKNYKKLKENKIFNTNSKNYGIIKFEVIEDIYNNIRELHIFTDKKLPGKVYFLRFGEIKK